MQVISYARGNTPYAPQQYLKRKFIFWKVWSLSKFDKLTSPAENYWFWTHRCHWRKYDLGSRTPSVFTVKTRRMYLSRNVNKLLCFIRFLSISLSKKCFWTDWHSWWAANTSIYSKNSWFIKYLHFPQIELNNLYIFLFLNN